MKDHVAQVAQYWNNIALDFDKIYSGDKNSFGRALDRWLRKDMYQRFDWVMRKTGNSHDKSICDLGCGSGRFVVALAKKGARITGVDVAPEMIKLASKLADREGVSSCCQFVCSDVLDWVTPQLYDVSIAIGFWDYVDDPRSRLRVIRGLTKTTFLSAWPRLWTWRVPVRKIRLTALGCPVHFYTRRQVKRLLEEARFEVVTCEVVGKLFCVEARPI